MFALHCPTIRARVLIWPSDIKAVRNTPRGIEVHFRCACDTPAVWLTGRSAGPGRLLDHDAAPLLAAA